MVSNSHKTWKRQFEPPFSSTTLILFFLIISLLVPCFVEQAAAAQQRAAGRLIEAGEEGIMMFFDPCEILTGVGTLTPTPRRTVPAAVTRISQDMIRNSGARSLYELFDIFVPNFQWIRHNYQGPHMGLRGIISDKEDKYLLLVNGRVLNERTKQGVMSERDLPMLDDIHHIDVVRGPGSAIYGLGAVSMVIDIHTENANTFQGTKVTTKVGAIEEFVSFEYKHGTMLDEDTGLYIYGGISDYPGADRHYAPEVFGLNDDTRWGQPVRRGKPVNYGYNRDRQSWRGLPKLKFHAELTKENLDLWARYTRGGQHFTTTSNVITAPANPPTYDFSHYGIGYQQITAYGKYHHILTDTLSVDYILSYDLLDAESVNNKSEWSGYREDEYLTRVLAHWIPNDRHSVAAGFENSTENFGLRSPGFPHDRPAITPRWSTNTTSLFAEHQFKVNDYWTTFLGARVDKNTYSPLLYSPRAAAVYTPTDKDTWKFIFSRSNRPGFAQRIRNYYHDYGTYADPEVLEGYELRYERQHTKNLYLAGSAFFNIIEIIGWDNTLQGERVACEDKTFGVELEAAYTTDRLEIMLSHSYSKLYDIDLAWQDAEPVISGYPYDDLANWSNHITKLYARYKATPKLSLDGSVVAYWGFPGLEDKAKVDDAWYRDTYGEALMDPGYDKAFRPNVYLNLGMEYKVTKNLNVRVTGHNLLGLFDIDLNKRNYLGMPAYRSHAPAISVMAEYRF